MPEDEPGDPRENLDKPEPRGSSFVPIRGKQLARGHPDNARISMKLSGLIAVIALLPSPAEAQEAILVLATGTQATDPQSFSLAARAVRARLAARNVRAYTADEARALVAERHSVEPRAVAPDELRSLETCAREAQEHVVYGRRAEAETTISRCIGLGAQALGNLHGEAERERFVFDSCLYRVQLLIHAEENESARAETVRCRRLAPFAEASSRNHPVWVREMVAEVDAELRTRAAGTVRIDEARGQRCTVVANGRTVGTSPVELESLPAGRYNVALECSHARSRVHRVEVAQDDRSVTIDLDFDAALHTEPELMLLYPTSAIEQVRRASDAQGLGAALGAIRVYLVSAESGGVRLDALEIYSGHVLASAWLSSASVQAADYDPLWDAALASLESGRSYDFRVEPPEERRAWRPNERAIDREVGASGASSPALGWSLAGAGGLAFIAAAVFVGLSYGSDDLYPTGLEAAHVGLGFGGGALVAAALPFLLEDGDLAWLWSALGAAVGLGLAGVGAYFVSTPDLEFQECADPPPAACVLVTTQVQSDHEIGWTLIGASLPFVSLAVTELVFALESPVTVATSFERDAAHFELLGTF